MALLGATAPHNAEAPAVPTVDFVQASTLSTEGMLTVNVTVQLDVADASDVIIPFTLAGTALDPSDYSLAASPLTILAGDTAAELVFTIVDDSLDEADETIEITLGAPTNGVLGTTIVHTLSVQDDDDAPSVDFTLASNAASEGSGSALATVQLSAISGLDLSVPFSVAGDATDPDDYSISASPIVILAGNLSADITVTLVDDSLEEADENIEITLGAPTNGVLGTTILHALSVLDDDTPMAQFVLASSSATEADGVIALDVSLNTASANTVELPFSLGGTATEGVDYTVSASPIILAPGDTAGQILITPTEDGDLEGDELILVTLLPSAQADLGTQIEHNLDLQDNEIQVQFTLASDSALESEGTRLVTAQLSATFGSDIEVPFSLSGDATLNADYLLSVSSILIPAGNISADLAIELLDDGHDELDETLVVTLLDPADATLGAQTTYTLTLTDNDDGTVIINEFVASNDISLTDEDGDNPDWIEIHNTWVTPVDITGWHLTDSVILPTKWTFPSTTLMPGEYLLVYASTKDRAVAGQELHTNFKLSVTGEYLALTDAGASTVSAYAPLYPPQTTDISYGYEEGTETESFFSPATPGAPNANGGVPMGPLVYSVGRGYFTQPFSLDLNIPVAGGEIRYTLDGSQPDQANGLLYSGPISIDEITTVRARGFAPGYFPSTIESHSYLFYADVFAQDDQKTVNRGFPSQWIDLAGVPWSAANEGTHPGAWYGLYSTFISPLDLQQREDMLTAIPSVVLTLSIDDWFAYDTENQQFGIYPNSFEITTAFDRNGAIEWIDGQGGPGFGVGTELSIQGNGSTRPQSRNQLSIASHFKRQYGPPRLEFPIFEDSNVTSFDYLLFDAGFQYSVNEVVTPLPGYERKRYAQGVRDYFAMELGRATGSAEQHSRYVHLYLNGLYWGVYLLHERADDEFGSDYFGGDASEYDAVKNGSMTAGNENPADHATAPGLWSTVLDIAASGVALGDVWNGLPAYDELAKRMDLEDYVDYLIRNIYVGNFDWPANNWLSLAHARNSEDILDVNTEAKFRYYTWDAEHILRPTAEAMLVNDGIEDRSNETSTDISNAVYLHTALLENPDYIALFGDRVWRMIRPGGALYVDPAYDELGTPYDPAFPERNRPAALYHSLALELEPVIDMEYARWGHYWETMPSINLTDWQNERQRLLEEYFPIRTNILLLQLRSGPVRFYPDIDPPTFNQAGGLAAIGFQVELSGDGSSAIFYTMDGSDPRSSGGSIGGTAQFYAAPFTLTETLTRVRARLFDGLQWSALEDLTFAAGVNRVVINEFVSSNTTGVVDEFGEREDWIEIHNRAPYPVNLSGWTLSDDSQNPGKWALPEGTVIAPKGYLQVWADNDVAQGPLHASFKLSNTGESVLLSLPAELDHFTMDNILFGPQRADWAMGRYPNGTGPFRVLRDPTPQAPNRAGNSTGELR